MVMNDEQRQNLLKDLRRVLQPYLRESEPLRRIAEDVGRPCRGSPRGG